MRSVIVISIVLLALGATLLLSQNTFGPIGGSSTIGNIVGTGGITVSSNSGTFTIDGSGIGGATFTSNANQFAGKPFSLKSGALQTNLNGFGLGTNHSDFQVEGNLTAVNNLIALTDLAVTGLATINNGLIVNGANALFHSGVVVDTLPLQVERSIQRDWVWQGFNTNQVINWAGTNWVIMQPSNTVTISFANAPAAGARGQVIDLWVYWTNTASQTIVWPSTIDIRSNAPAVVFGITNIYHIWAQGTNQYVISDQDLTTGVGPLVAQTNATLNAPTFTGTATMSSATISTSTMQPGYVAQETVRTNVATNAVWFASMNYNNAIALTNTLGGSASTLFLTNVVDGKWFVFRALVDSTARTITISNVFGGTVNVINTNGFSGVGTIPTVSVTASKIATICGRAWTFAGTTNVDLWSAVQQ